MVNQLQEMGEVLVFQEAVPLLLIVVLKFFLTITIQIIIPVKEAEYTLLPVIQSL